MKHTREITDTFMLGDVTVTMLLDADRRVQVVRATRRGGGASSAMSTGLLGNCEPEVIEQIALLVRNRRWDAGDYRGTCLKHGYYESSLADPCPKCTAEGSTPPEDA